MATQRTLVLPTHHLFHAPFNMKQGLGLLLMLKLKHIKYEYRQKKIYHDENRSIRLLAFGAEFRAEIFIV